MKKKKLKDILEINYLVYGITVSKLHKVLTVRAPFVIHNSTLFDFYCAIRNNE